MTKTKTNQQPQVFKIDLAAVALPTVNLQQLKYSTDSWVKYGSDNLFPNYLCSLLDKCQEHSAFVQLRQNLIAGEGFSVSDNIKEALANINQEYNADELLERLGQDLGILETFAIQVIWDKAKKKIAELYYIDSSLIRPDKTLDVKGNVIGYWFCSDWSNVTTNKPVFYPRFDLNNPPEEGSQIYFYHKHSNLQPYFPKVSYVSALNYIELAAELSKFGLSTVVNGFFSGGILEVKGNMQEDQKREFTANLQRTYQGSENAQKMLVIITEEGNSVTLTNFSQTDNTNILKALNELVVDKLSTSHRGNPSLASVMLNGSSLGGDGNSYTVNLQIYQNTVIRAFQKAIISFFKKVLSHNGFKDYELDIQGLSVITTQMDENLKADYIKPETWIQEYGYSEDDLMPDKKTIDNPVLPNAIPPIE
ncbi:phage portal protein [Xanthocytophaga agilis]|uniref:Phage portal protein n=1 Tax=Xanthocytophaga agilis TaxID=3048010 RepID=A0AAE3R2W5_9BACT|nr:phage portal protein [Xanthocytophaga agilis]MDJ1500644.1 phage portal protein [Xanthocytophaga agilis]